MEAADGMVMGCRAAVLDGSGGAGLQHVHELLELAPLVQNAAKGEVEAGPVGIDVGEAASHGAVASGYPLDGVAGDPRDLLVEVAHALPGHRSLEGRGQDATGDGVLAVV